MQPRQRVVNHRYVLQQKLGEGGMGVVYRANDRLTGQTVALKRVIATGSHSQNSSKAASGDFRLDLAQEFSTLSSLRHPNIISVLDYGFDEERQPYFTMDLLDNPQTIRDAAGNQDVAGKVNLLIEVLQALAYLHRRGIIHRDLKPGNVLVNEVGQVKVVDFGLSVASENAQGRVGTLAYISPEVLRDGIAEPASDLYAVGVMAYEFFTGNLPFEETDVVSIISRLPDLTHLDSAFTTILLDVKEDQKTAGEVRIIREDDSEKTAILDHSRPEYESRIPAQETPIYLSYNALVPVVGRLLAKEPVERYADAQSVIAAFSEAIDQPAPEESIAIRESFLQAAQFVGRETEFNQLSQALVSATEGKGSSWLVGGESGVGKSRLLDELRTYALVEGVEVLYGQGVEGGGLPYQYWREPMRRLTLSAELSDLDAGVLKEVVPDIHNLLGRSIADAPALDGKEGQQRLVLTIADVFKRQKGVVVLFLEDLQWAEEGLEPLKALNRIVADYHLLIVASYRHDDRPDLPDYLPDMQLLKLERLTETAVAELSESMLGEAGRQPRLVEFLHKETEGNVFFMIEVVRVLAEEAGRLHDISLMALPERVFATGMREVVRRRLEKLAALHLPLLKLAAVAGREVDPRILSTFAESGEFDEWVLACAAVIILEIRDNRWRFAHEKLREAVLEDLIDTERTDLHTRVAEAIEHSYPANTDYAETLMNHWRMAGNTAKELHYILLVAKDRLDSAAEYLKTYALLERGLAISSTGSGVEQKQLTLYKLLGDTSERLGNYKDASQFYDQSLALADQIDDNKGRAYAYLGNAWILWRQSEYDRAKVYAQKSLDRFQFLDDVPGIAHSLNILGNIADGQGNKVLAESYYQQSLDKWHAVGDRSGIAKVLSNLGNLADDRGDFEAVSDYVSQSLAIWRELGNRHGIAISLNNLGFSKERQKDFAAAHECYSESLALFTEINFRLGVGAIYGNLAFVGFELSHSGTEQYLLRSTEITHAIGAISVTLENLVGFARIKLMNDDAITAAQLVGMIRSHPASNSNVTDRLDTFLPILEQAVDKDDLEKAMKDGETLDLDQVVLELLGEAGNAGGRVE